MPSPETSSGSNDPGHNPAESLARTPIRESESTVESDSSLLARVAAGDERSMTALYDRYSRLVYSVAFRVLRDAATAEDVLQDIFMGIWRKPESFVNTRGSLPGWLAVVARNRAIDALRRRKSSDSVDDVVLASDFNLAEEAERNVLTARVRGIVTGLPAEQRKVVEMAFFDGLTHSEIAALTGDPLGTVKTRIRSALLVLRKGMQA